VLQSGGEEVHPQISAGDKDLKPAFEAMCNMVTIDIMNASGLGLKLSDDEMGRFADCFNDFQE